MTLNLYIARRFLGTVGRVFLIFFAILLLIDTIEQLRRFSGAGVGLSGAGRLALLNVPETLYRILPLILIMGAIANFLGLARSSELVVVRAAGPAGAVLQATDITAELAPRLARFKLPTRVVFMASLPTTALGKVARTELRRRLAAAP